MRLIGLPVVLTDRVRAVLVLVFIGALFLALLSVAESAEDRMLDTYSESAERASQQGRPSTAEELFLSAIRRAENQALSPQDPRLIRSLRGLAEVYRAGATRRSGSAHAAGWGCGDDARWSYPDE